MSRNLVEKAKLAVSSKLNELRATCGEDLTLVNAPLQPSDLSNDSESEEEEEAVKSHVHEFSKKEDSEAKVPSRVDELMKERAKAPKYGEGIRETKRRRKLEREKTCGKGWFHLPATEMTKEIELDLMVIRNRHVLNPKKFFKGFDTHGALPKYFQIGTVADSAADFYTSRIPKKQRKQHIIDELLADPNFMKYNKKKYAELNESKRSKKRKQ